MQSQAGASSARTFRRTQWIYLMPVLGAPLAHIFVSLMRRYPQHKKSLLMLVVGSTAFAVINRMWLMADAGYAGSEDSNKNPDGSDKNDRYVQLDRETAARKYWTSQAALLGTQQDQGASSPAESETKTGEQRLR